MSKKVSQTTYAQKASASAGAKSRATPSNTNTAIGTSTQGQRVPPVNESKWATPLTFAQKVQGIKEHEKPAGSDRFLFLVMNLIGTLVEVTLKNGDSYEGVLHASCPPEDGFGIVLKMVKKLSPPPKSVKANPLLTWLIVKSSEFASLSAKAVSFDSHPSSKYSDSDIFRTDTDISRGFAGGMKTLEKWEPAEGEGSADDFTMMDDNGTAGWDQFATNESLYGVTTDFNMDNYTTVLDKSSPDYRRREAEAARIASEIEKSSVSHNPHLLDERNIAVDDGMDEEDKYSGVLRTPVPAINQKACPPSNKYVPPQVRKPDTKPLQQPRKTQEVSIPPFVPKVEKKVEFQSLSKPPANDNSPATEKNKFEVVTTAGNVSVSSEKKKIDLNTPTEKRDLKLTSPLINQINAMQSLQSKDGKPIYTGHGPHTGVDVAWQEFTHLEKQRIQMKRQHLLQKEKDGVINDFKAFSATFKINSPIPDDMLPILNKDKTVSEEKEQPSKQKSSSKSSEYSDVKKPSNLTTQSNTVKNQTTSHTQPSTTELAAQDSAMEKKTFKFNPAATEFKLSATLPEFVPGGGMSSLSSVATLNSVSTQDKSNAGYDGRGKSKQYNSGKSGYQTGLKNGYQKNLGPMRPTNFGAPIMYDYENTGYMTGPPPPMDPNGQPYGGYYGPVYVQNGFRPQMQPPIMPPHMQPGRSFSGMPMNGPPQPYPGMSMAGPPLHGFMPGAPVYYAGPPMPMYPPPGAMVGPPPPQVMRYPKGQHVPPGTYPPDMAHFPPGPAVPGQHGWSQGESLQEQNSPPSESPTGSNEPPTN